MITIRRFFRNCGGEQLSCVGVDPDLPAAAVTAVVLHGAGTASKERYLPLMTDLAHAGCSALSFDFSGHGESSGRLRDQSLRRRRDQARTVIDTYVPDGHRLVLIGFSMSGQTVADLSQHYGDRVTAIALCAPAVYDQRAWSVQFGSGFTDIIRVPDGWRKSTAFSALRGFKGTAVLVTPGSDAVIPVPVTAAIADALGDRPGVVRLRFEQADHRVGNWLAQHPEDRADLITALLSA